jgi:hypothetical protein
MGQTKESHIRVYAWHQESRRHRLRRLVNVSKVG